MCNNPPNKQCWLSRADKPKLITCMYMLVILIPRPSPSFPSPSFPSPSFLSLAIQTLAQLPITCSTDPRPASHRLQYRPSPSFPSLAVQTLAQLPIACSTGPHPASCRLQYWPSPSFLSLAVSWAGDWERGCILLVALLQSPPYPGFWWAHWEPGYEAISTKPSATCSNSRSQKWCTSSFFDLLSVSVERAVIPWARHYKQVQECIRMGSKCKSM